MIYVRGTNPYQYRSGEWAHLFSIQHTKDGKDLWVVEFPDGDTDVWPSWDAEAGYDVRIQIEPPEDSYADQGDPQQWQRSHSTDELLAQVSQRLHGVPLVATTRSGREDDRPS